MNVSDVIVVAVISSVIAPIMLKIIDRMFSKSDKKDNTQQISAKMESINETVKQSKIEIDKISKGYEKIQKVVDRNGEATAVALKVNKAILEGLKRHGYDLNGEGIEAQRQLDDLLLKSTSNGLIV